MTTLEPIGKALRYNHIIGVGGIGSGIFFSLEDNHTLGRNESRMATLRPWKDFCKQHIIMHYVAVLLGASDNGRFQSFPIGKVGNDVAGENLLSLMRNAGMNTTGIDISEKYPTLFSVCFQYPDLDGGNITAKNSASSDLSPADVDRIFTNLPVNNEREMLLAAPEVSVDTRIQFLKEGRKRKSFNVASVLSGEADAFGRSHAYELIDLLAVNLDEARHIAGIVDDDVSPRYIVDECARIVTATNPQISVIITNGSEGSYCCSRDRVQYTPSWKVDAVSTAGAGDAFLSGTITGLCCGLPLTKENQDEVFSASPINSAVELGTLLAAFSVTSADTIHLTANADTLYTFAAEHKITFGHLCSEVFRQVHRGDKAKTTRT